MKANRRAMLLVPLVVGLLLFFVPSTAMADVGSNIVGRFWDSLLATTSGRMQSGAPDTVTLLQQAEQIFLGQTEDFTTMSAIRDVYTAMRVAGLLLLGLCTVLSLAEVTEAGMSGHSMSMIDWVKRFAIAAFMTMGGIHFYGLWIRLFNSMLYLFRNYLDTHWQGPTDPSALYTMLLPMLQQYNLLLTIVFAVLTILALFILWFLIGGVRMAELIVAVIIAPLVWPLYLLPSLEDIPKTAFRGFLGLNAVLLIVVAMLRLAVRMVSGGALGNTLWNYVPALSLLFMTIFLPSLIKRLVGQGNTGTSGLMTVAYALAGLKGVSLAASAGAAAAHPPAAASLPQAPSGPSSYPLATLPSGGSMAGFSPPPASAPIQERFPAAPRQLGAGSTDAAAPALEAPYNPSSGDPCVIDMGQSQPGSNQWDMVVAVRAYRKGLAYGSRHKHDGGDD